MLAHAKGFCRAVALNSFVVSPIYFFCTAGTYVTRADAHLRSHIIRVYTNLYRISQVPATHRAAATYNHHNYLCVIIVSYLALKSNDVTRYAIE